MRGRPKVFGLPPRAWGVAALVVVSSFPLPGCGGGPRSAGGGGDPAAAAAYRDEALARSREGRPAEALQAAARFLALEPGNREAYALVSGLYLELGDDEGAAQFFEVAARRFPDQAPAWFYRGYHAFRLSRWDDALRCFRRAAELDPDDPQARFRVGLVLQAMGRFDEARAELQAAYRMAPEDPVVAARLARILRITGDYEGSARVVTEALRRHPDAPDLLAAAAQLELKRGEPAAAEALLRRALERNPWSPAARQDLARVLETLGRPTEARREALWAEALRDAQAHRDALARRRAGSADPDRAALDLAWVDLSVGNVASARRWLASLRSSGGGRERRALAEIACALEPRAACPEPDPRAWDGGSGETARLARAAAALRAGRCGDAAASLATGEAAWTARERCRVAALLLDRCRAGDGDGVLERCASLPHASEVPYEGPPMASPEP